MHRYLFENNCFSRVFGADAKISTLHIKKFRELLAKNLEINYEDVEVKYYKNTKEGTEVKLEAVKEISKYFVFRVIVSATEKSVSIISLETYISRAVPVYSTGINYLEDVMYNIMKEFSEKSFYKDLISEYKLKYEEVSKRIFEDLETLFGFYIESRNSKEKNEGN